MFFKGRYEDWLNYVNNPTGRSMSQVTRKEVVKVGRLRGKAKEQVVEEVAIDTTGNQITRVVKVDKKGRCTADVKTGDMAPQRIHVFHRYDRKKALKIIKQFLKPHIGIKVTEIGTDKIIIENYVEEG